MNTTDILISDFTDPLFRQAFTRYFEELGVSVRDWDALFQEMNNGKDTWAFLRVSDDDTVVGFLLFSFTTLSNWFFETRVGFVREFWVGDSQRCKGHGAALLALAEEHFIQNGIFKAILTTDTAEPFYIRHGYSQGTGIPAKNNDPVFVKNLR